MADVAHLSASQFVAPLASKRLLAKSALQDPLLLELPELLDESSPLLDAAELLLLLRASLSSPLIHLDFLAAESHPQ